MFDNSAFISGVTATLNEVAATGDVRNFVTKVAGILATQDSFQDLQNSLGDKSLGLSHVLQHNLLHSLPYSLVGAGIGGVHAYSQGKDRKGIAKGMGLGAAAGTAVGGTNDLVHLGINEKGEKINNLLDLLDGLPEQLPEGVQHHDVIEALRRVNKDSWYNAVIPKS